LLSESFVNHLFFQEVRGFDLLVSTASAIACSSSSWLKSAKPFWLSRIDSITLNSSRDFDAVDGKDLISPMLLAISGDSSLTCFRLLFANLRNESGVYNPLFSSLMVLETFFM
jgi:hypothetical protein